MARKRNNVVELPGSQPLTAVGKLRRRLEGLWRLLILVGAILAAGWGAHEWQSRALKSSEDAIREMQERLGRVEAVQGEMRDDLKLIKRKLIPGQ